MGGGGGVGGVGSRSSGGEGVVRVSLRLLRLRSLRLRPSLRSRFIFLLLRRRRRRRLRRRQGRTLSRNSLRLDVRQSSSSVFLFLVSPKCILNSFSCKINAILRSTLISQHRSRRREDTDDDLRSTRARLSYARKIQQEQQQHKQQ